MTRAGSTIVLVIIALVFAYCVATLSMKFTTTYLNQGSELIERASQ